MTYATEATQVCLARLEIAEGPKRLLHGRGGSYAGHHHVVVDWYPPYVLIGSFDGGEYSDLVGALAARSEVEGVLLQMRRGRETSAKSVMGHVPEEFLVEERSLAFRIRPYRSQNVGLFLDMAPIRDWVRERALNKKILNLFAYTCAFSVYAIAGGAEVVFNNDMSRPALDWGRDNHRINRQDLGRVKMLPHNVFRSWGKLSKLGPYDMVICDPPTLQRGSFVAETDYGRVIKRLTSLVKPGGDVLVCLNSPFLGRQFIEDHVTRWGDKLTLQGWLRTSTDFNEANTEAGLKVGHYRNGLADKR